MPKPTIIVPVENQVRELDAKLLFACVAAERGFPIILGSRTFVHYAMPFFERGIYLAKSMRPASARMFDVISRLGHEIVAWDEESLVRFSSPEYYAWRFSPETFRHIAMLFTWGEDDAEMFRGYAHFPGMPLRVTGNPRVDLLRPELRRWWDEPVARLRERFGEFVLVNTNFPFVNGFVGALKLVETDASGVERTTGTSRGLSLEFARSKEAHQRAIFEGFRELLPALASAFPERTIVLRPHPSERADVWQEIARRHPNVRVTNEGNVVPWLIAARVLVHNGCTTAVEASVVGTPAVAYRPIRIDVHDYALPNALSHQADTIAEAIERVGAILEQRLGGVPESERRRVLDRHLASIEGPLACDRIVEALLEAGYGERELPRPELGRYLRGWLRGNVRTVKKLVNRMRPNHRHNAAYHAHRFPRIAAADLEARIARFREHLGRFDAVRVRAISRHLFRIGSAG